MKIGIAGYGFVGQAHHNVLKDYHEILISDPAKGHYQDLRHCDAIIVCVSTPPMEMSGACDVSNVCDVIDDGPDVPYLIKSTISIQGWDLIVDCCKNKNITFSPEFLRAEHALEDFKANRTIMLGGESVGFWSDIFLQAMGKINIDVASPKELIITKYARNSFLALKVAYFNQIKDLCDELEIDYNKVRQYTIKDNRIGESHTTVTDDRGFGGHCFPKDTLAILRTSQQYNAPLTILDKAIEYNQRIRKEST